MLVLQRLFEKYNVSYSKQFPFRVMSEIQEKMVNWVWLALLVPLVTKVPVDHQVSPARLVLMVSLELLVSLAALERRDPRVCKAPQALPVSLDRSVWLDLQDPLEDLENAESVETLDRKAWPVLKDKEEPLVLLVSRERRAPLDPRERRV